MIAVLIVGAANVGKTTYGGMLAMRLQRSKELALRSSEIADFRIFANARDRLLAGLMPIRTKPEEKGKALIRVTDQNNQTNEIVWPDYSGESFAALLSRRTFTKEWEGEVSSADAFIVMIRPMAMNQPPDALSQEPDIATRGASSPEEYSGYDAQPHDGIVQLRPDAQYVEWFQMMRHIRGEPRLERSRIPVTVILSCWDELPAERQNWTPECVLMHYCPLLGRYLKGGWSEDQLLICGLSTLEQTLTDEKNVEYINKGPMNQGYVVDASAERHSDLTLPLAWTLERGAPDEL